MATDKALNIRQVKATEQTAADIANLRRQFEEIKAQLDRIEAALGELSRPTGTARSVAKK